MHAGFAARCLRPLGYCALQLSGPRESDPPRRLGRPLPNHSARPAEAGGWSSIRTRDVPGDSGFTVRRIEPLCQPSVILVPRARLERASPGFVGQCSDPTELAGHVVAEGERVERSRRSRVHLISSQRRLGSPATFHILGGTAGSRTLVPHRCSHRDSNARPLASRALFQEVAAAQGLEP